MLADKPTELSRIKLKNLNSTARPYDQQAFSPLDPTVSWLSHLALAIYIFVVVNFDALAQVSYLTIWKINKSYVIPCCHVAWCRSICLYPPYLTLPKNAFTSAHNMCSVITLFPRSQWRTLVYDKNPCAWLLCTDLHEVSWHFATHKAVRLSGL